MKKHFKLNQFTFLFCFSLFLFSCNSVEKDWQKAELKNSKEEYRKFIRNHPSGTYTERSKIILDSFECKDILKEINSDTLELFLTKHVASIFLKKHPELLDSIDWHIAIYSKDTVKYRNYINKYPKSYNLQTALDSIWSLKWPPYHIVYGPHSIVIHSHGKQIVIGQSFVGLVEDEENGRAYVGPKPTGGVIDIWRNFTEKEKIKYSKIGILPGLAYYHVGYDKLKFVKKIDLAKSDLELCREFKIKPYDK